VSLRRRFVVQQPPNLVGEGLAPPESEKSNQTLSQQDF